MTLSLIQSLYLRFNQVSVPRGGTGACFQAPGAYERPAEARVLKDEAQCRFAALLLYSCISLLDALSMAGLVRRVLRTTKDSKAIAEFNLLLSGLTFSGANLRII